MSKNFEDVNAELQLIAQEEQDAQLDLQYEEFLAEMYYYLEMQQYQQDCYDEDARYYGEIL